MCEMIAFQETAPGEAFALSEVLPLAAHIERLGIAGFGWGVAWHDPTTGQVQHYRSPAALRDDPEAAAPALLNARADAAIIHLRRPNQLSTVGLADTQPFYSQRHGCAFAHNGDFAYHERLRPLYLEQGLLHGKADSEVGFRLFEDMLDQTTGEQQAERALRQVYTKLEGRANLLALMPDGSLAAYAQCEDNWMFTCQVGSLNVVVTALYSWDQSIFDLVLRDARQMRRMEPGEAITLTPAHLSDNGNARG
jgi:predicted glutamine amidotransferase